ELVHLLRSDVLRRILRGAVLHARAVRAWPRQRRDRAAAVAQLQSGVAGLRSRPVREVLADGRMGYSGNQHADPAVFGSDRDMGPLGSQEKQPGAVELRIVPDG